MIRFVKRSCKDTKGSQLPHPLLLYYPRKWRINISLGQAGAKQVGYMRTYSVLMRYNRDPVLQDKRVRRAMSMCIPIEVIIKDPVKHYRAPRDVVADNRLTREEKRRILDSWALDSQLIAVADEENMSGSQRPGLREVKLALLELERSG